jgi:hypothetical protein
LYHCRDYFFPDLKKAGLLAGWGREKAKKIKAKACNPKNLSYLCNGKSVRPAPTELPQVWKEARVGG